MEVRGVEEEFRGGWSLARLVKVSGATATRRLGGWQGLQLLGDW